MASFVVGTGVLAVAVPGLAAEAPAPLGSSGCPAPPASAAGWATVFSAPDPFLDKLPSTVPAGTHGAEISVDPWQPCHVFRALRDRVERSVDSGAHWSTVLQDPSESDPASQGGAVSATGYDAADFAPVLHVAPGEAYLVDRGGDDGVFRTSDGGTTWAPASGGLVTAPYLTTAPLRPGFLGFSGVVAGDTGIRAAAFAASDPSSGYIVASVGGETVLSRTTDAGELWTPVPIPQSELDTLAVDPTDANHVLAAGGGGWTALGAPARAAATPVAGGFWESTNGGTTWTMRPGPRGESPFLITPVPVAAASSQPAHLRLYAAVLGSYSSNVGGRAYLERFQSSDDGATWTQLPLPVPVESTTVAPPLPPVLLVDPSNPRAMVWAALDNTDNNLNRIVLDMTTDGFATSTRTEIVEPSPVYTLDGSVDRYHDFYIGDSYGGGLPQRDVLRVLHVDAATPGLPGIHDLGAVSAAGTCSLDPIAVADQNARARAEVAQQNPDSGQAADMYWNGSLAYDGRYLDYTQDDLAPGIVYRIDPATCTPAAPLRLAAPPTGSTYAGEWTVPALEALSYDPAYRFSDGHTGAILARGHSDSDSALPPSTAPVYAIDPQTGGYLRAFAVPCSQVRDFHLCDNPTGFSYDLHRGAAWVAESGKDYVASGLGLAALTGGTRPSLLPTCMTATDWSSPFAEPFGPEAAEAAMWVAGGRDTLYAQTEDGQSVYAVDSATCAVTSGFRHAPWQDADEHIQQMACDPVSFGHNGSSVLWLRNSQADTVVAYPVPEGTCPFPTTVRLDAVDPVAAGSTASVCATLYAQSSPLRELAGQALRFTVGGATVSTTTNSRGRGCVVVPAGAVAASLRVRVEFGGNTMYLPAVDSGLLDVQAAAVAAPVPPPQQQAPRRGAQPPAPVPAPPPLGPVEAVPVVQQPPTPTTPTQPNPQAAPQPGVMAQEQERQQLSTEDVAGDQLPDGVYQATAARGEGPPWMPAAALGAMVLGLVALRRRSGEAATTLRITPAAAPRRPVSAMARRRQRGLL